MSTIKPTRGTKLEALVFEIYKRLYTISYYQLGQGDEPSISRPHLVNAVVKRWLTTHPGEVRDVISKTINSTYITQILDRGLNGPTFSTQKNRVMHKLYGMIKINPMDSAETITLVADKAKVAFRMFDLPVYGPLNASRRKSVQNVLRQAKVNSCGAIIPSFLDQRMVQVWNLLDRSKGYTSQEIAKKTGLDPELIDARLTGCKLATLVRTDGEHWFLP